jgi:hypothetical protein
MMRRFRSWLGLAVVVLGVMPSLAFMLKPEMQQTGTATSTAPVQLACSSTSKESIYFYVLIDASLSAENIDPNAIIRKEAAQIIAEIAADYGWVAGHSTDISVYQFPATQAVASSNKPDAIVKLANYNSDLVVNNVPSNIKTTLQSFKGVFQPSGYVDRLDEALKEINREIIRFKIQNNAVVFLITHGSPLNGASASETLADKLEQAEKVLPSQVPIATYLIENENQEAETQIFEAWRTNFYSSNDSTRDPKIYLFNESQRTNHSDFDQRLWDWFHQVIERSNLPQGAIWVDEMTDQKSPLELTTSSPLNTLSISILEGLDDEFSLRTSANELTAVNDPGIYTHAWRLNQSTAGSFFIDQNPESIRLPMRLIYRCAFENTPIPTRTLTPTPTPTFTPTPTLTPIPSSSAPTPMPSEPTYPELSIWLPGFIAFSLVGGVALWAYKFPTGKVFKDRPSAFITFAIGILLLSTLMVYVWLIGWLWIAAAVANVVGLGIGNALRKLYSEMEKQQEIARNVGLLMPVVVAMFTTLFIVTSFALAAVTAR